MAESLEQPDEGGTAGLFMPEYEGGKYSNPFPTWTGIPSFSCKTFGLFCESIRDSCKSIPLEELDTNLPVVRPDLTLFSQSPASGIRHMWIGHASSLVQFDGLTFLTDPVFSERAAIVQFMGPKRFRSPPCTIDELPKIDCVFISHNHYDHLDHSTVTKLNHRFGASLRWYVPLGLKSWITSCGCQDVVELTWWGEYTHSPDSSFKMVATPSQYWSKRSLADTNKTLWCSWCVLGPKHRFYFSGDTGYCAAFSQIGQKYGPFHLATIPIGAYEPRWLYKSQHIDPAEAVNVHKEIQSKQSIGIHWGTFRQTSEPYLEPKELLALEAEKAGLGKEEFVTVKHGEVRIFSDEEQRDADSQ